jgi:formiminoglutamase
MSNYLSILNKEHLQLLLNTREGEVKLGEKVQLIIPTAGWQESIESCNASFVLVGIPEDIGVRANGGVGGAHTAWIPSLQALLNIQSTPQFSGEELLVLGSFDFTDWIEQSQQMNAQQLRELVAKIDEEVYPVIRSIIESGKIPIVIGGGHNNSYPLLRAASLAFGASVNCINLDAHSDYRIMEGRHSGNGFRYAKVAGFLNQYALIGLHENYNSESVLNDLIADETIQFSTYEDIFLRNNEDFEQAVLQAINFTDGLPTGIELDLDCIQNVLSSANTPSGISTLQARQYVHLTANKANTAYLHVTEGATKLANGREDASTGKLIAYLMSDFIKATDF